MDTKLKRELSLYGDTDIFASAIRAKAVREYTGLSQEALGKKLGVTKPAISNAENARSFPTRDLIVFMAEEHRIDPSFLILGHYQAIPEDVQTVLFNILNDLNSAKVSKS